MSAGAIVQGILLIMGGVFIIVFSVVILRSETWVEIVTDQLLRRRPGAALDRRRLASGVRAAWVLPTGVGGIFVALGLRPLPLASGVDPVRPGPAPRETRSST